MADAIFIDRLDFEVDVFKRRRCDKIDFFRGFVKCDGDEVIFVRVFLCRELLRCQIEHALQFFISFAVSLLDDSHIEFFYCADGVGAAVVDFGVPHGMCGIHHAKIGCGIAARHAHGCRSIDEVELVGYGFERASLVGKVDIYLSRFGRVARDI